MSFSVLGMVGSARPWGNSELVVRQALLGAQAEGASVQLLRLTSLRIQPCTGCMRCVIGRHPCPLDDDMAWLIQAIEEAGALVLAAPTYWLGPAAQIKLILDRLLMVTGQVDRPIAPVRQAVTVTTAGLEGWRGISVPFLNALVSGLGFWPIESLAAIAPGPGEVLLDDGLMARVWEAGRRLARPENRTSPEPPGATGCPVCRCEAMILWANRAVCPICASQALVTMLDGHVTLRFLPPEEHPRWSPEGLRAHMVDWVQATGPRYLSLRGTIKARRAPYRQKAIQWLHPRTAGQSRDGESVGQEE